MGFIQSYYTDKGEYRKSNQDALAIVKAATHAGEALLCVVCDGMGGYAQGELASKHCIDKTVGWFKKRFPFIIRHFAEDDWRSEAQSELDFLIRNINEQLVQYGSKHGFKIGTTLTGILLWQNSYLIFHVGGSRAYLITDQVRQLTTDDSLAAQQVSEGKLTEEEARHFKKRNVLTECVGVSTGVEVKFYLGDYFTGDSYLLCSDGFWHNLEDSELAHHIGSEQVRSDEDMQSRLQYLVSLVYERGEHDNSTVIGIRVA